MKFRSKLVLLVGLPLCALIGVTVPGFTSRLDVVNAETRAQHLQAPANAITTMVQGLDNENALSNWYVGSGDPAVHQLLASARVQTDRELAALRGQTTELRRAGAGGAASRLAQVVAGLDLIGQQRQFVDVRVVPIDSVTGFYQDTVQQLLQVVDSMGTSLHDATQVANLRDFATVLRIATAAGEERAILTAGFAQRSLAPGLVNDVIGAVAAQDAYQASFEAQAGGELRQAFDARLRAGSAVRDRVRALRSQALNGRFSDHGVTPREWYDASTQQGEQLYAAAHAVLDRANQVGLDRKHAAKQAMLAYGAGAVGVLLLALALAIAIARATTRPLGRLTRAAHELSEQQLPALLDAVRAGGASGELEAISAVPVESRDEIGELARAFNAMEDAVVEVAREQGNLLRQGVSELYVNLARRNQSLLDRQIRAIDDLERDETDADRLDSLFHVDHLATRMRRNAESLLVLAGAEQVRRWGSPVPVLDVVRSAASEITDYARVDVQGLDGVNVVGAAVIDLTHLLAELLENATSFSPPESRVVVGGTWYGTTYVLSITDQGIGMADDRLAAANALLAEPPAPRLALSRSLGLFVVAHLAARVGVSVELRAGAPGVVALVALPANVLHAPAPPVPVPVLSEPVVAPPPVPPVVVESPASPPVAAPPVPPAPPADVDAFVAHASAPVDDAVAASRSPAPVEERDETPAGLPRRRPVPGPELTFEPTETPREPAPAADETPERMLVDQPVLDQPVVNHPGVDPVPLAPPPPIEPAPYSEPAPYTEPAPFAAPAASAAPAHDDVADAPMRAERAYAADDFLPRVDRPHAPSTSRAPRGSRTRPSFSLRRRHAHEPDAWLEPEGWHDDDDHLSWLVPDDGDAASVAPTDTATAVTTPRTAEPVPTTPSGLPQRVRGSHVEAPPAEPAPVAAAPTQRAPEQVFELLARYEAGRRRGVTAAHADGSTAGEPAGVDGTEER